MLHMFYLQRMSLGPPLHNSRCTLGGFLQVILSIRRGAHSGVVSTVGH